MGWVAATDKASEQESDTGWATAMDMVPELALESVPESASESAPALDTG
jgi:hypothetical protein